MPPVPLSQSISQAIPRLLKTRQHDIPQLSPEDLTLRLLLSRRSTQDASSIIARQSNTIYAFEDRYQGINAGPAPGAVVGIVLGSVAGFLLLIWLLWVVSNGGTIIRTTGEIEAVETVRPRSKRTRSRRPEMASRTGSPRRVYRSERIIRDLPDRSVSPSVRGDRDRSRIRETIIVDDLRGERRVEGDDMIEVMEEHSSVDAPRRKNRRSDRSVIVEERVYEEDRRVSGGYRTVDPRQFGGGSFRPHQI